MKIRVRAAMAGLSVVLLAPACGSSGGGGGGSTNSGTKPTAASFVHQVCSSIVTGVGEIKTKEQNFAVKAQADQSKSTDALKADTVQFLGDASSSFQSIQQKISQADVPDVQNAAKGKAALLKALTTVQSELKQLQSKVQAASTKDKQTFQQTLQTDLGSLQSVFANVGTGLSGLSSKQLDDAAKKDPSCKQLSGGAAPSSTG